MKYKAGDKVRIKSLDWYNENKGNADKTNSVWCKDDGAWFFYHMSLYCGKVMTIEKKWAFSYILEGSDSRWTDEMIEGLAEEPVLSAPNISEGVFIPEKDMKWTTEWNLPEGYIFRDENGNVINATKIVLEKKKKEYPKTYEECCKVLGSDPSKIIVLSNRQDIIHEENKHCFEMYNLYQLLICRDAYWKIAGEEMGLEKPWKPDWTSTKYKYCITTRKNKVEPLFEMNVGFIFAFPTEEMRDAFRENFKELIEHCKELL